MTFNEMISPMPDFRTWGAISGDFQFVISLEIPKKEYRASWKHKDHLDKLAVHMECPYSTFTAAEAACADTWKQLRRRS
jgi:hypothetical protein